jgi:hypothetical protein
MALEHSATSAKEFKLHCNQKLLPLKLLPLKLLPLKLLPLKLLPLKLLPLKLLPLKPKLLALRSKQLL